MGEIARWTYYRCRCGGDEFVRPLRYRRHPSFGTSEEPATRLRCVQCHAVVSMDELERHWRRTQLRQEIAAKEAALSEEEAYAHPRAPVTHPGASE